MRVVLPFISIIVAVLSFVVYIVHKQQPYNSYVCVGFGYNCPITKSANIIPTTHQEILELQQILSSWIENGYSSAFQLSLFINNEEKLNFYIKNDVKYPKFDDTSIVQIFSSGKTFAAIMINIAIENGWIESYNNYINKYWPKYPTKRILTSFDTYTKYFDTFSNNFTLLNNITNFIEFNKNLITIENNYKVTIEDILRHEGGFGVSLSSVPIIFETINYKYFKEYTENHEYLLYFIDSPRLYHAFGRAWILNQLFINVEPNHRSMHQYFKQEILPKIDESGMYILYSIRFI